jgi:hypothetical protein
MPVAGIEPSGDEFYDITLARATTPFQKRVPAYHSAAFTRIMGLLEIGKMNHYFS